MDIKTLFWSKVKILSEGECWEWQASKKHQDSYGAFSAGRNHGLPTTAHRVAYILTYGPIPEGQQVLHHCDHRPCCNPKHLFLGVPLDNVLDKVSKGRQAKGPKHSRRVTEGTPRGATHYHSLLDDDKVRSIRKDERVHQIIAKEYGVVKSLISRIKRRKCWTHVAD